MIRSICGFIFLISGCLSIENKVDVIDVFSEDDLESEMYIYFNQDTSIGRIIVNEDRFSFGMTSKENIYFLRSDIGKGEIEFSRISDRGREKVDYFSPMDLKNAPDSSFQIVGGSLRAFRDSVKNVTVRYITFKAAKAYKLKGKWQIDESEVVNRYYNNLR